MLYTLGKGQPKVDAALHVAVWYDIRAEHQVGAADVLGHPLVAAWRSCVRANQVWSTEITYVQPVRGFFYMMAVIDCFSCRVLNWRVSNSMQAAFPVGCLEYFKRENCKLEVFCSNQGSQFTSVDVTE